MCVLGVEVELYLFLVLSNKRLFLHSIIVIIVMKTDSSSGDCKPLTGKLDVKDNPLFLKSGSTF